MNEKLPIDWSDVGIKVPGHSHGNVKVHCPQCHNTRNNKNDKSLSVNLAERMWQCHYPPCGWSGRLYSEAFFVERKKRQYKPPTAPDVMLSEKAMKWLRDRGLSERTVKMFKVSDGPEWMPQTQKAENCIRFPYYRDRSLVNIKYRDGAKNFKLSKDAELIFFNLDSIIGVNECVIVEGELDCMSVYDAGILHVISVPNGGSLPGKDGTGGPKLEYLDNCFEAFDGKKKIILATDGDRAGIALRNELARRLGKHRCFFIEYPSGCKDLNEVLLRHGKENEQLEKGRQEIKTILAAAAPFPVEGVFQIREMEEELDNYFQQGDSPGDNAGYSNFDSLLNFSRGQLTIITGIPSSGKSAFLDQLLVRLSSRHGWRHAMCSFENQPTRLHVGKLTSCFVGRKFNTASITDMQWNWAKYFIDSHFLFYNTEDIDLTVEGLINKAIELVMQYGIDSLVIDPWNYVEFNIEKGATETQYISKALSRLVKFARAYGVHVFLVAHPTKMAKKAGGKGFEVPNLYSISGSAHFYAKTDNGITVYLDEETKEVVVYVQKVRFSFNGKKGMSIFTYEVNVGRYSEQGYGYENELQVYLNRIKRPMELFSNEDSAPREDAPF
jgi:twinkle protein